MKEDFLFYFSSFNFSNFHAAFCLINLLFGVFVCVSQSISYHHQTIGMGDLFEQEIYILYRFVNLLSYCSKCNRFRFSMALVMMLLSVFIHLVWISFRYWEMCLWLLLFCRCFCDVLLYILLVYANTVFNGVFALALVISIFFLLQYINVIFADRLSSTQQRTNKNHHFFPISPSSFIILFSNKFVMLWIIYMEVRFIIVSKILVLILNRVFQNHSSS